MAHVHGLQKIKKDASFDCSLEHVVLKNVSGRTIFADGVNLFPDDTAWYCGQSDKVDKLIAKKILKTIETNLPKSKAKKQKDEKSEETSATVAEPDGEASVQLGSSEDDVALTTEQ
jgi:hypothetical protein